MAAVRAYSSGPQGLQSIAHVRLDILLLLQSLILEAGAPANERAAEIRLCSPVSERKVDRHAHAIGRKILRANKILDRGKITALQQRRHRRENRVEIGFGVPARSAPVGAKKVDLRLCQITKVSLVDLVDLLVDADLLELGTIIDSLGRSDLDREPRTSSSAGSSASSGRFHSGSVRLARIIGLRTFSAFVTACSAPHRHSARSVNLRLGLHDIDRCEYAVLGLSTVALVLLACLL